MDKDSSHHFNVFPSLDKHLSTIGIWGCMTFFSNFFFFLMWMIFKVFIELVTVLLLFNVLVFLAKSHMGSWLPNQGLNPHPLFWKVKS